MLYRLGLVFVVFMLWSCSGATPPSPQPTPEGIEIILPFEKKLWTTPPNSVDIKPLATLPKGTAVRVIWQGMRHNGFWLFIRTEGYEGYIEEGFGMLTPEQREQLK